jgi:hypothetical protein
MSEENTSPENAAPEPQATTAPETQPAQPNSGNGEKLFTGDEVEEIVKSRLSRERSKGQRKPKPKPSSDDGASSELLAKIEALELGRNFDRAVSGIRLDDVKRSTLEMLFRNEMPDSPKEWAEEKVAALGWAQPTTNGTDAAPAEKPPAASPNTPPTSDGGAPGSNGSQYHRADNPLTWSRDHLERIVADKGSDEGRKFARQQLEQYLRNTRVVLPTRK